MSQEWYRYEAKVLDLAEFLVQSEEISTTDELLNFFKYPERYTEVWNIYEKEILGDIPTSTVSLKKGLSHKSKQTPAIVTPVESCSCNNV